MIEENNYNFHLKTPNLIKQQFDKWNIKKTQIIVVLEEFCRINQTLVMYGKPSILKWCLTINSNQAILSSPV